MSKIDRKKEAKIKSKPWAEGLGWRTIRVLSEHDITTEKRFIEFKTSWKLSYSVLEEIRSRQHELKLEKGLIDPREPMSKDEVKECLHHGGLLFVNDSPILSLGRRGAPKGEFLCVSRGHINFRAIGRKYQKSDFCGFKVFRCQLMQKTNDFYGVRKREGYDDWKYDVELTREIFGLDYQALELLLRAYVRGFQLVDNSYQSERITCSYQENSCDISDNYIPAYFPFIALTIDTKWWGGHISITAFIAHIKLLTMNFSKANKSTKILIGNGLTPEIIELLEWIRPLRPHVKLEDLRER